MLKSTHRADVVSLDGVTKHPNADKLGVLHIDGYTVVLNLEDWAGKSKAVYVKPDSLVDTSREEFAWLAKLCPQGQTKYRVTAKRIRGVVSFGLLTPCDESATVGDDYAEKLGIEHYEIPDFQGVAGMVPSPRGLFIPKYDLESLRSYQRMYDGVTHIDITEKLHGENMRVVCVDGVVYAGSRTNFWEYSSNNPYGFTLLCSQEVVNFVKQNERTVVYGESIGGVKGFPYGVAKGQREFRVFDILRENGTKLRFGELDFVCNEYKMKKVPTIAERFPIDKTKSLVEQLEQLANGKSNLDASHVREGIVISPSEGEAEKLKLIGSDYLMKS